MEGIQLKPWNNWPSYKLVASLSQPVSSLLEEARKNFRMQNPGAGKDADLEIIFFKNRLPDDSEYLLVNWLEKLCAMQPELEMVINNFSGIPPHLIYARVQKTPALNSFIIKLENVLSQLSGVTSAMMAVPEKWRINYISHLSAEAFDKAMQHFSPLEISMTIPATQLELKKQQPDGSWRTLQRFQLAAMQHQSAPWYESTNPKSLSS